jgi:hypothetical protein
MFRDWRPPGAGCRRTATSPSSRIPPAGSSPTTRRTWIVGSATWPAERSGREPSAWSENALLRDETPQSTKGVYLGWDREATEKKTKKGQKPGVASYAIRLPDALPADWPATGNRRLVFCLANNKMDVPETDLTVEVTSAGGAAARLPLSRFAPVSPPRSRGETAARGDFETTRRRSCAQASRSAEFARANAARPGSTAHHARLDRTPKGEVVLTTGWKWSDQGRHLNIEHRNTEHRTSSRTAWCQNSMVPLCHSA